MYRLNVNSTVDAGNANVGAENLYSIWVGSTGGRARVYGGGRMVAYTNMDAATSTFYLAQIEAVHAGKTMVITLFDPGESSRRRVPADPQPGRQRLQLRDVQLGRRRRPVRHGRDPDPDARSAAAAQFNNHLRHDHDPAAVDLRQRSG